MLIAVNIFSKFKNQTRNEYAIALIVMTDEALDLWRCTWYRCKTSLVRPLRFKEMGAGRFHKELGSILSANPFESVQNLETEEVDQPLAVGFCEIKWFWRRGDFERSCLTSVCLLLRDTITHFFFKSHHFAMPYLLSNSLILACNAFLRKKQITFKSPKSLDIDPFD